MQKYFFIIVYLVNVLFLNICSPVIYAESIPKNCPPNHVIHGTANNFTEIFTQYEEIKKVDVMKLSPVAKQQLLNTIAVYDYCDEKSKMKFIAEFPNTFQKFLDVFQQKDFSQLYLVSGTCIDVLEFIADEHPERCVGLLVSLSSEAQYDVDAPSGLHDAFINFFIKNPDLTIAKIKQLDVSKQKNIASFLADVETIETYPEYKSILNILKTRNETQLYNMFVEAKKNKIQELVRNPS